MTSGITILAPLLVPIAAALKIDLLLFGMVMVFTLGIGNMSPPFGIVLYQVSSLLQIKLEKLIKADSALSASVNPDDLEATGGIDDSEEEIVDRPAYGANDYVDSAYMGDDSSSGDDQFGFDSDSPDNFLASDHRRHTEFTAMLRDLFKRAEGRGYLTHEDINEVVSPEITEPELIDNILTSIQASGVEIRNDSDEKEAEGEAAGNDKTAQLQKGESYDDPIRMYLHQMGQVPLLSRDQEIDICMRIEKSEENVRKGFNHFAFAPKLYSEVIMLIETQAERFDRIVSDKYIDTRDDYMKQLPAHKARLEKVSAEMAKINQQLNRLPMARQREIAEKYHDGAMPWKGENE